jgi:hypothetical protein
LLYIICILILPLSYVLTHGIIRRWLKSRNHHDHMPTSSVPRHDLKKILSRSDAVGTPPAVPPSPSTIRCWNSTRRSEEGGAIRGVASSLNWRDWWFGADQRWVGILAFVNGWSPESCEGIDAVGTPPVVPPSPSTIRRRKSPRRSEEGGAIRGVTSSLNWRERR